jgi:hypothetical protein
VSGNSACLDESSARLDPVSPEHPLTVRLMQNRSTLALEAPVRSGQRMVLGGQGRVAHGPNAISPKNASRTRR